MGKQACCGDVWCFAVLPSLSQHCSQHEAHLSPDYLFKRDQYSLVPGLVGPFFFFLVSPFFPHLLCLSGHFWSHLPLPSPSTNRVFGCLYSTILAPTCFRRRHPMARLPL